MHGSAPRIRILREYPPMIDEIDEVFRVRGKRILFAWGDRVYSPNWAPKEIPVPLLAHEAVHLAQQREHGMIGPGFDLEARVRLWWGLYMSSPAFRLSQEIDAHRAEVKAMLQGANRHMRRAAVAQVAQKLAAPLYGNIVTLKRAKELLAA
jgi:hypothetical protein